MWIYKVYSNKHEKEYSLAILEEKRQDKYRIVNLTKNHICPCTFNSIEDAYNDILDYVKRKEIKIVEIKFLNI